VPGAAGTAGIDLPRLYVHAIDALDLSGDGVRAGLVSEEAYRRFADHPEQPVAAVICQRAAHFRDMDAPAAGLPLIKQALRLFEPAPPSADHAEAWFDYANTFQRSTQGRLEDSRQALDRALQIAQAADARALIPRVLGWIAMDALLRGQVEEGLAFLQRGRALAQAAGDGPAPVWLAIVESEALLKLARFQDAADAAVSGLGTAGQVGLDASWLATVLAFNACEALLALGRTDQAAALVDPLTSGPPDRDHWPVPVHEMRAEIDMLRGNTGAAAGRQQLIDAIPAHTGSVDQARESAQRAAELAMWMGRPGDALDEVRQVLPLFKTPARTILCGRLLGAGMRACADLAEQARARRDQTAAAAAAAAARGLASWAEQMSGAPFTEHPFVATIPAERATWDAERTRLAGPSNPGAWGAAAKAWQDLGCPHRAGYTWWRQAQAQLDGGQPATEAAYALRAAAAAAAGHAPLLTQVRALGERARIPLQTAAAATTSHTAPPAQARERYGLTGRELAVLRLLAAGRTNAQIGAELYISPRTAGVHVTNILRKLGVSGRVQAATLAERAGLLP
jgi:DNA-binding CsgD family transcriptional regulator/tetratricopeptide (TPR) repeat protein